MLMSKQRGGRGWVVNILLVAIGFGLLGLTLYSHRDQISNVFDRRVDVRLFLVAFAVYMLALLFTFSRWYLLVRVIEPRFRLGEAFLLGFIGNLFNLVIPGAVGGDLVKATYLVQMKINRTQAVASMVIDRILGLLGLFILAGIAGLFTWPMADRKVRILIGLVGAAVVAGLLVLTAIFSQSLTRAFPRLTEGDSKRAVLLRELKVMSETYRQRLGLVASCLLGSSFIHSLFVVAFYLVCRAIFGSELPGLPQHLLIVPLTLFSTAVPLPFGALGFSENVGETLGKMVGHPGGLLGTLGFRVLMYGAGLICAIVYLANLKQVRALTESAREWKEDGLVETIS
jgi:uncharacterized protein (TIRG00374 family)